MKKRTIKIGSYDTALHGWTLAAWSLSDPVQKTKYIEKTGGDGSWDLSTALTDGVPKYNDRELSVTLECSEGSREKRTKLISEMTNLLDGYRWEIVIPDHPEHFIRGRVSVGFVQNGFGYAEVTLTAVCEPWLYAIRETRLEWDVLPDVPNQKVILRNSGRLAMVPTFIYINDDESARLHLKPWDDGKIIILAPGSYEAEAYLLPPGEHELLFIGNTGRLAVTYREAVLR